MVVSYTQALNYLPFHGRMSTKWWSGYVRLNIRLYGFWNALYARLDRYALLSVRSCKCIEMYALVYREAT